MGDERLCRRDRQNGLPGRLAQYDESKTVDATVEMAIQINGKLRGTMQAATDLDNNAVIAQAHATEVVQRNLEKLGGKIVKTIVVKNKLVNVIIK